MTSVPSDFWLALVNPLTQKLGIGFFDVIGNKRCPILDTWWQTETGSIMMSPLPGITDLKPGAASLPLLGVNPEIKYTEENATKGSLVLKTPWPSMARTIFNDHKRYQKEYWCPKEKFYKTSDGAFQMKTSTIG